MIKTFEQFDWDDDPFEEDKAIVENNGVDEESIKKIEEGLLEKYT